MRASVLIIAVAAFTITACGEDVESHYRTYAELELAGEGPRSWMPSWLPRSATDIHDWHNLDTNATRIAFSVPRATPALLTDCRPTTRTRKFRGFSDWWPDERTFATLQHFECEERTAFADGHVEVRVAGAAIDMRAKRVYFWR